MDETFDTEVGNDPDGTGRWPDLCPRCGSDELRPILYGLPIGEAFDAADRGEIVLGGCVISDDDPQLACRACGLRFHDRPPDPMPPPGGSL